MRFPLRLRPGQVARPGLVKIQFESLEDKIKVFREKHNLRNSEEYKKVFLRSSKPHAERLTELNFKTVLELIPKGSEYGISANGKITKKEENRVRTGASATAGQT